MSNPLIVLTSADKRFKGSLRLSLPAFDITHGDRVLVVGDNGSGKSTLLRIVAGLSELDAGTCERSIEWPKLRIGYLPQEGGLYRDLSIRENLLIYRRLLGRMGTGEDLTLAERLGIADALDKRSDQLSGGIRRLGAIYCLLSSNANALVLDEPSSSLDVQRQSNTYALIEEVIDRYSFILACEHVRMRDRPWSPNFWTSTFALNKTGTSDVSATRAA